MRYLLIFILSIPMNNLFAQEIKVITYNIRYNTPADSANQWSNRASKVIALISKYNPDILGVQEAKHDQVMDLARGLTQYNYVGVGRDDGKTSGEYSAIFYKKDKLTVIDQNTFWLSENPQVPGSKSWDAAITRIATWAKLKEAKTGKVIFMLNTHFDHVGKEARRQSAILLKKQIAVLSSGLPTIVTGDLNCMRADPPYKEIVAETGARLFDPAPADAPGTFCSFKVNSITCRAIDYILHTAEWKPSGYEVITDNDGKYYPSDHLPVAVTLILK